MSPKVEHEGSLEALETMLEECQNGRGGVLVLSGPMGSGKTKVLHSFAERTLRSDALVLTAAAAKSERELRFEVMAQLFQPLSQDPRHHDLVDELLKSDACATALAGGPAEAVEKAYVQVFHMLWMILAREMSHRPVVMLVDDVQHSDESSLRGLVFLARRFRFTRVMLVLAERTGPHHQRHPLFHADLFRQPHCRQLRLNPLNVHGVAQLLGERLGAEEARRLAPEYLAATGGNPLLVGALVDDGLRRGSYPTAPGTEAPPLGSGSFGDAVIAGLHRVGPPAFDTAAAAAVLGEYGTPERIATLLDADDGKVRDCVDTLNAAGLLAGARLRHPAAELAVLGQLAPEGRRCLQIRAAALLHEQEAPGETVARRLLDAGAPLPEWSVEVLRAAAQQALLADRTEEAARCLELAYATCRDERARGAITVLLAVLEWRGDPSAASRRFAELRAMLCDGRLAPRDANAFVRLLLWHGAAAGAVGQAEIDEVLRHFARLPLSDDPVTAAETRFLWTWLAYSFPQLARRSVSEVAAAPVPARSAGGGLHGQAADILATATSEGVCEATALRAERLLEHGLLQDATLLPLSALLTMLADADRTESAARWCDQLLAQAAARNAPTWQAVLSGNRAEIALRQGDLPLAKEHARSALEYVSAERWGAGSGLPLSVLVRAATEMGDLGEAARVVRQPISERMFESRAGLYYLQARGHYYLARGWFRTAHNDFQRCGELAAQWGVDNCGLLPWRLDLAEAYVKLDQTDRARAIAGEQLVLVADRHARVRGTALRVLAAGARPPARRRLLVDAVRTLRECDDRLELARALTDLAEAHAAAGGAEEARRCGEQASALAMSCHAEPLVQRAGLVQERRSAGLVDDRDRDPLAVLSESERRVAALAVQGFTNRQIAHRLFITVSTVEQHLTSTYRKLKVNRRAELPSRLELVAVDSA